MIWIAVAAGWIATAYRARSTRRSHLAWWSLALTISVMSCAVGMTVYALRITTGHFGPGNLWNLGAQVPLTIAAAGIQVWMLSLVRRPLPAWTRWGLASVAGFVVTAMCTLWFLSPMSRVLAHDFTAYRHEPSVLAYFTLFYGYGAVACAGVAAMTGVQCVRAKDSWQKLCLGLVMTGSGLLVAWLGATWLAFVRGGGGRWDSALPASVGLPMSLMSLGVLGLSVAPAATRVLTSSWTIVSVWRLRRRLLALAPEVQLPGPRRRMLRGGESLEVFPERCLIEISDAATLIKVDVPPRSSARQVARALRREDGRRGRPLAELVPPFADAAQEQRYLRRLGRAYR